MSSAKEGKTSKFLPRRDGPYVIMSRRSPTTYEVSSLENPTTPLGVFYTSALKAFEQGRSNAPILPLRKRGRPRKTVTAGSLSGRLWNQRGRM
ncbi:integrase catalytic domain-containing protein [Nephila pilipes]|uniref:Integrase catalytic domain-containing protein n=1 Tax=Nephila pilipes TaxID=299642 RepID=A0A8X6MPE4_NEPPI|nr:integrase catalytic domain-containing protein [Nephila pilipes]